MAFKIQNCCGCCGLHIGTLIVGIFGIILSVVAVCMYGIHLSSVMDETAKNIMIAQICSSCLSIIINALLIYGTIKESRYFLLPWLILSAIGLAVYTVIFVIHMFSYPLLIIAFLVCVALWYVWLCVLSYFQELNPGNRMPMNG